MDEKIKAIIKGKTILQDVRIADSFLKRFRGLMFLKGLESGHGLLIKPCNSVHCFFMRFTIDVLFLDKENKIIKVLPSLKPWRVSPIVRGAVAVLECQDGTIQRFSITEGDKLELKP